MLEVVDIPQLENLVVSLNSSRTVDLKVDAFHLKCNFPKIRYQGVNVGIADLPESCD